MAESFEGRTIGLGKADLTNPSFSEGEERPKYHVNQDASEEETVNRGPANVSIEGAGNCQNVDIDDDIALFGASRVRSSNPYMRRQKLMEIASKLFVPAENAYVQRLCHCSPPSEAVMRAAWNFEDKGRRVLKCKKNQVEACNFECFIDPPITGRAKYVIDVLYSVIETMLIDPGPSDSTIYDRGDGLRDALLNMDADPTFIQNFCQKRVAREPVKLQLLYDEVVQMIDESEDEF